MKNIDGKISAIPWMLVLWQNHPQSVKSVEAETIIFSFSGESTEVAEV